MTVRSNPVLAPDPAAELRALRRKESHHLLATLMAAVMRYDPLPLS